MIQNALKSSVFAGHYIMTPSPLVQAVIDLSAGAYGTTFSYFKVLLILYFILNVALYLLHMLSILLSILSTTLAFNLL